MEILPEEIIRKIITLSECYICYVLEREPDEEKIFLEGGIMVILGQVLKRGADIRALMFMKRFIPASLAIWKAIHLQWIRKIITRVCLIWNSWESSSGHEESVNKRFTWGIDHIYMESKEEKNQWVMNRIYYKMGMIDRLDLTVEDPFGMVSLKDVTMCTTLDDIYLKYKEYDVNSKIRYYTHKGDISKLEEILREKLDEDYKMYREFRSIRARGRGRKMGRSSPSPSPPCLQTEWDP